ncbi:hypothetical protein TNCV_4408031 [Trichonephila clavipes]|nr:hypothetical protein TNCV_4408031 [Trichonephila clavipes]
MYLLGGLVPFDPRTYPGVGDYWCRGRFVSTATIHTQYCLTNAVRCNSARCLCRNNMNPYTFTELADMDLSYNRTRKGCLRVTKIYAEATAASMCHVLIRFRIFIDN